MNTSSNHLIEIFNKLKTDNYYEKNPTSLNAIISAEATQLIGRYEELITSTEKNKKNLQLISKYKDEINKIKDVKEKIIGRKLG